MIKITNTDFKLSSFLRQTAAVTVLLEYFIIYFHTTYSCIHFLENVLLSKLFSLFFKNITSINM